MPILRRRLAGVSITVQRRRAGKTARVVINSGGKRITRNFDTIEAAKAFAAQQEIEAGNAGARAASEIGDNERRTLLSAKEALAAHGKTLADAVAFYLKHLTDTAKSAPVGDVIDSLIAFKKTEKKSVRYLLDLTSRLTKFRGDFEKRAISSITADEVNHWLAAMNLSAVSTNNTRRVVAVLMNFAAARGLCPAGIMRNTTHISAPEKEPEILSVAECEALLRGAPDGIRAALAIGLFAGVRDAELQRMDWSAVDFENDTIIVKATVAKLAQRRTIPMRPNLRAWLEPLRQLGGSIMPPRKVTTALTEKARSVAGFKTKSKEGREWPHNGLRHSYATYRLAHWPDAAALALEMGNSPAIILRHYRSLVTNAAATSFWSIQPENHADGKVIPVGRQFEPAAKTTIA
ncbi:MAG TPA: site-specific integrase [Verrucomicrobiales bacterium]|nr:site-specific integrase [Verrucomicrobiales bacterium]